MVQQEEPRKARRSFSRWMIYPAIVLLALVVGVVVFLSSSIFQEMARSRIVTGLEQRLGTKVELREFLFDWPRLEVRLRGLVLYGDRLPDEPPLLSVEQVNAGWNLISIWRLDADFEYLRLLEPKVHVAFREAGGTNLPALPRPTQGGGGRWAERLIGLRIGRLDILEGEIQWNQSRIPLQFQTESFRFDLSFEAEASRYAGSLSYRNALIQQAAAPALPSEGEFAFHLYADHATIESFDLRAGESSVSGSAEVARFESPEITFSYETHWHWRDIAALLGKQGWEGTVDSRGTGTVGNGTVAAGRMELLGTLDVRTRRTGLAGWSGIGWNARSRIRVLREAVVEAAPNEEPDEAMQPPPFLVQLDDLVLEALGGELHGRAEVRVSEGRPETTLDARAENLSFPLLSQALSALPVRQERLPWMATLSGPVHANFSGDGSDLVLEADLEVVPPLVVPPGFTRLAGRIRGSYHRSRRRFEVHGTELRLPRTRLLADGWAEPDESNLRFSVFSSDWREALPAGRLLWENLDTQPLQLDGNMQTEMTWTGGVRNARVQGRFGMTDFSYGDSAWSRFAGTLDYSRIQPPARGPDPGRPGRESGEDATDDAGFVLAAELKITAAELRRLRQVAEFDLELGLETGGFTDRSPFLLEAGLRDVKLTEWLHLAGMELPVQGMLDGTIHAEGTKEDPTGHASVVLTDGTIYEERFDRLQAELRLNSGQVVVADSFRLERGEGFIAGRASIDRLRRQFDFSVSGEAIALENLQVMQRLRTPLSGFAEGTLAGSGSYDRPEVNDPEVPGPEVKVPEFNGEIRLTRLHTPDSSEGDLTIQIRSLSGRAGWSAAGSVLGGTISGEGETALQSPYPTSAALQFQGLELTPLIGLWREPREASSETLAEVPPEALAETLAEAPPAALEGRVVGNLRLEGNGSEIEQSTVEGRIVLEQLRLLDREIGALSIDGTSRNGQARWSMAGDLLEGRLNGTGEAGLRAPYPVAATVQFHGIDLPPLIRLWREPPEGLDATVDGFFGLKGEGSDWGGVSLDGELTRLEASSQEISFRNAEPVSIRYGEEMWELDRVHLVGEQVDLSVAGTIRMAQDPVMNLTAQGHMELAALSGIDPQLTTSGLADLDGEIAGTFSRPEWRGRLGFSEANFHYGSFPNSLTHINGAVVFEGNRAVLEDLRAESGGGQILFGGAFGYGEGTGIQFNLTAEADRVRIRYPAALSTWVDANMAWSGTVRGSILEGRVTLTRQSVVPPYDLAQVLLGRPAASEGPQLPEVLRNIQLNLEVDSAPEIRLDSRTARNLQTAVQMRIQGTMQQPAWLGRIGILQGEIEFAGKRYTVNRGEIAFLNPFQFEPVLNLSVQARVQQYDISMDFSGPPDRLTVTYRSDPPLPTRDIVSLLVAGSDRSSSLEPAGGGPLPQIDADTLLSQALSNQIGTRLDRLFGTGRLRVDPRIAGLGNSTTASVALEQQITNDFTLLYVTDVTEAQQQIIQAEWIINPLLSVVGLRDKNGLIGVNFQITLRFR